MNANRDSKGRRLIVSARALNAPQVPVKGFAYELPAPTMSDDSDNVVEMNLENDSYR